MELLKTILWSNSSILKWSTRKDWKTGYVIKTGPTEKFLWNERSPYISGPQLNIKNQIIGYCSTFWKILKNYRKFCERSTIKYDIIYYGVTMDIRKKSFIKSAKSCPHWLKIKLWKDLGRLVQKYRISMWKTFFLILYATKHFFRFYFRYGSNWS